MKKVALLKTLLPLSLSVLTYTPVTFAKTDLSQELDQIYSLLDQKDYNNYYQRLKNLEHTQDARVLLELGWAAENGFGRKEDMKVANQYYLKSAELGHNVAMNNIGNHYYYDTKDYKKAFYWYQKGAEAGNLKATYNLGKGYYEGTIGKKDISKAIHYLEQAAQKEHFSAKKMLLDIYTKDKHFRNFSKAYPLFVDIAPTYANEEEFFEPILALVDPWKENNPAAEEIKKLTANAEQGDLNAASELFFYYGTRRPEQTEEMYQLAQKLSDKDFFPAQVALMILEGSEGSKFTNTKNRDKWLETFSKSNEPLKIYAAAHFLDDVLHNDEKAKPLFQRACANNFQVACSQLR